MDWHGLKCAGRIRPEGELTRRSEEAPPKLHLVGFSDALTVLLRRRIRKKVYHHCFRHDNCPNMVVKCTTHLPSGGAATATASRLTTSPNILP